jgi:hypothetical protein
MEHLPLLCLLRFASKSGETIFGLDMCSPKRERREVRIYGEARLAVIETEDDVLQIVWKDWSELVIPQPAPEQDNEPLGEPDREGNMAHNRAADDFQTIRARLEELRRQREEAPK